MNLKTYETARARITKVSDEKTRSALCFALEAYVFARLTSMAFETARSAGRLESHYRCVAGEFGNIYAQCKINEMCLAQGRVREVYDFMTFVLDEEKKEDRK